VRLRGFWNDLVLLVGVVLHPVRQWKSWHSVTAGFLHDGGATIDTPPAGTDHPIGVRTVIQPDGDVLVIIDENCLHDGALLGEHSRRVAEWYEASREVTRRAVVTVRALILAASGGLAVASGRASFAGVHGLTGSAIRLAISAVTIPLVGLILSRLASFVLRRRIHQWLAEVA